MFGGPFANKKVWLSGHTGFKGSFSNCVHASTALRSNRPPRPACLSNSVSLPKSNMRSATSAIGARLDSQSGQPHPIISFISPPNHSLGYPTRNLWRLTRPMSWGPCTSWKLCGLCNNRAPQSSLPAISAILILGCLMLIAKRMPLAAAIPTARARPQPKSPSRPGAAPSSIRPQIQL